MASSLRVDARPLGFGGVPAARRRLFETLIPGYIIAYKHVGLYNVSQPSGAVFIA